jgi:hypothetical protein
MRAIALAVLLAACGDNNVPTPPRQDDAPVAPDSPVSPPKGHCIDRPDDLPLPPIDNQLPCDLLPPGFVTP